MDGIAPLRLILSISSLRVNKCLQIIDQEVRVLVAEKLSMFVREFDLVESIYVELSNKGVKVTMIKEIW